MNLKKCIKNLVNHRIVWGILLKLGCVVLLCPLNAFSTIREPSETAGGDALNEMASDPYDAYLELPTYSQQGSQGGKRGGSGNENIPVTLITIPAEIWEKMDQKKITLVPGSSTSSEAFVINQFALEQELNRVAGPEVGTEIFASASGKVAVSGKTKRRKINSQVKVCRGKASTYGDGDGFNGRKSANGERFNRNKFTAASNTLPLNSFHTVCRADITNLCVRVKITDTGGFGKYGRIIDLSSAAAERIGFPKTEEGYVTGVKNVIIPTCHPS